MKTAHALPIPDWMTPNAWVDWAFYNVDCLDADEVHELVRIGRLHQEAPGTIVQVWPRRAAGRPRIQVAFARERHRRLDPAIDTVVLAGVGSSILGTAALAKDVADRLDRPVAGIVTGFGAAGALIDALTGWYWYGAINRLDEVLRAALGAAAGAARLDASVVALEIDAAGPAAPDAVLRDLLLDPAIHRAIAHSKGGLQLGPATCAVAPQLAARAAPLRVGTLGAVVDLPACVRGCQILGQFDWLGLVNSSHAAPHVLAGRSHSLNPAMPFGISLRDDVWGRYGADSAYA